VTVAYFSTSGKIVGEMMHLTPSFLPVIMQIWMLIEAGQYGLRKIEFLLTYHKGISRAKINSKSKIF
jgi:hypothetical protein